MVQRYDIDESKGYPSPEIVPDDLGCYVQEEDYQELEKQLAVGASLLAKQHDANMELATERDGYAKSCRGLADIILSLKKELAEAKAQVVELRERLNKAWEREDIRGGDTVDLAFELDKTKKELADLKADPWKEFIDRGQIPRREEK